MSNVLITVAYVLVGLGFGGLGVPLALGRVPPNGTYGFRTRKTRSSAEVWYAANRVQGIDLCVGGVLIAALTVALYVLWPSAPASQLVLLDGGIMLAALGVVVAHGFLALGRMRSG